MFTAFYYEYNCYTWYNTLQAQAAVAWT